MKKIFQAIVYLGLFPALSAHAELKKVSCSIENHAMVTAVTLQPGPTPDSHTHQPPAVGSIIDLQNFYDLIVKKKMQNCVDNGGSANEPSYSAVSINESSLNFPGDAHSSRLNRQVSLKISGDGKCAARWKVFNLKVEFPTLGLKTTNNLILSEEAPSSFDAKGAQYFEAEFRVPNDSATGTSGSYIYPPFADHYSPSWKVTYAVTNNMHLLCMPMTE